MESVVCMTQEKKNKQKEFFAGLSVRDFAIEIYDAFESVQIHMGMADENSPFPYVEENSEIRKVIELFAEELLLNIKDKFKRDFNKEKEDG